MPRFQTVLDGLEDDWAENARLWREKQEQQFRKDFSAVGDAVRNSRPVQNLRAVGEAIKNSRPGQVVSALVADRAPGTGDEPGIVDRTVIDRRIRDTQSDIRNNLRGAAVIGHPEAMYGAIPGAFGSWLGRVWPGGAWDDKHHPKAGVPGLSLERQGNYSYGATAAALGLPENLALRGAGLAQRASAVGDAIKGKVPRTRLGGLRAPYGDDPRDQAVIREGYAYGRERLGQGR
jgi:hypothetical protein